jgi:ribonuclease HI
MNLRPPTLPHQLRIWQQNVHKSKTAQDYVLNTANPSDWDVIALQEPWIDKYGNSRGSQFWRVVYPANFYDEGRPRVRSILLINTNLSTDCYISLPILHSDITAVRFRGENGYLSLFNVYNEITNNDTLTCLDSFTDLNTTLIRPTISDCVLWLGDFNRHHPMWEDDANERLFEPEEYISPLINLLYKNDMLLSLPKGIPTFQASTGNWTRPDNVWRSNTPDNLFVRCDTVPAIRPPLADHMPIITILDLPLPRTAAAKTLDFRAADWPAINSDLQTILESESPAARIESKEEFYEKVNSLVHIISETLAKHLVERRPNPFKKRWWTKELSLLKKAQNRLSSKSFKLRHLREHPIHAEHRASANKFKEVMRETREQDWKDWLETITQQDLYIANKYITSEPSDFSCARIPTLNTTSANGLPSLAEMNADKVTALAESFFPPPPANSHVPPNYEYPPPLPGLRFFSRTRIRQALQSLSPYKAPGPDKIPNVVLMKCAEALIDHLFFIFRAVFELKVYHPRWLESITLVLRKPGKTSYDVAKSYRPIGLIDTIPKVLSTLCSRHISYLAEKHDLLPPTQFGGRPGRNTTDAMLLVVHKIKTAWRQGKVAAALFLDVQGAFPNTVKDQLIHNMRMRRVPDCFTNIAHLSLTGRTTKLKFDDFTSEPLPLINGTTQGDPSSMNYYSFYNAPLIETASSDDELSSGFVDDSMMLAIGDTLELCHAKLKDMMERVGGGFEWSLTHNSPFELTKTALMNFPRSYRDPVPGALSLTKPNLDGSVSTSLVHPVLSYKYLGVIFDPKLRWSLHQTKALTTAAYWSSRIWRLSKSASGVSPSGVKQLYNTVAVPRFTYGAEVWYTYLHKPLGAKNTKGSVAITNKLRSTQRIVAKAITGGLSTTAGDIFDVHALLLPIDLLFCKLLYRAALRLCSLPPTHPLRPLLRSASRRNLRRHLSPIHHLLRLINGNPGEIETITPSRRSPGYTPSFKTVIPPSKEDALPLAILSNATAPIRIYSDGSGYEGGIGASALLYIKERLVKVLRVHLGSSLEHTVYEAEGVGLILGLHLLNGLTRRLTQTTILGTDSQAIIKALSNQKSHAGQYILDAIHHSAERLHEKQDRIINREERQSATDAGEVWTGRKRGVVDLQIHWVPGHCDFIPNERADKEAKKAAQGKSSDAKLLPPMLRKRLPLSVPALRQSHNAKLMKRWTRRWKQSPRHRILRSIDSSAPSKKYLRLIKNLDRRQASILFQLRSGHIGLNQHLFRIRRSDTPSCPHCQDNPAESVKHFLLDCPQYARERHELRRKLRRNADSLPFLLSHPSATLPLLKYVHATGRFKPHFGKDPNDSIQTNARRNAEQRSTANRQEAPQSTNVRNVTNT